MSESTPKRRFIATPDGAHHSLPEKGSITLGSAPAADGVIHLDAPGIEARHCIIGRTKNGGYALKDLGSHAGCLVNGERVQSARLKTGDRLELAGLVLVFNADGASAPKPAQPKSLGRLGGFRIEAKLGHGGMGEVLLAVQESLDRRVALKLLKKRLADDADFVQRFQTEAKSAAALNHPHVVHVYDVGIVDGRHYLAMEYMDGGTLEERVTKEGPLDATEVHRILSETAAGLAFAESRGIVHRDIKPENLMLDNTGRVKIADLGLATSIEAEGDGKQPILGTPHFMAPEQARGGKVDGRADLYALGATAYRLLTGKTPFQGATTRDILRAHFTEDPPSPSAEVAGVPAELDAVIVKLLAKEPQDRFASANDLIAALAAIAPGSATAKSGSKLPLILVGLAALAAAGFFLFGDGPDKPKPVGPGPGEPGPAVTEDPPKVEVQPTGLPAIPEVEVAQPEDNEQLLENLEKLARSAYAGLSPITDPAARKAALDELSLAFPGTTTASEAALESAALEGVLAANAAAASAIAGEESRLQAIVTGVRSKATNLPDGAPQNPAALLAALVELPPPGDAALAAKFEQLRRDALQEALKESMGHALIEVSLADELAEKGDFDAYQARLEALVGYFDLTAFTQAEALDPATPEGEPSKDPAPPSELRRVSPQDPPPDVPPGPVPEDETAAPSTEPAAPVKMNLEDLGPLGLDEFLALRDQVLLKIAQRPQRETVYRTELRRGDRERLSAALFAGSNGTGGLASELASFAFDAASLRFNALVPTLATPEVREEIHALATEVASGQVALDALISNFPNGQWRRDSLPLPRSGYAKATAIDGAGLTVAADQGSRTYTWSDYQGEPELIDGLFKNRLRRDYTSEEYAGIACIARFAAVQSAIARADRVLIKSDKERFDAKDAQSMHDAFEVASEWDAASSLPAATTATARELAAVDLLASALLARVEGRNTLSAARFDKLLRFHAGSLTVLLLSDGRGATPHQ